MNRFAKDARRGFTLVEMLVVITIIGILAGLITVAAMNALGKAKETRIKLEVDNVGQGMEAFKGKFGSYPPCDLRISDINNPNDNKPLRDFVNKAWPRYNQANLITDLQALGVTTTAFRPDQALVFWLSGFSPDVTNPFVGGGTREAFFEFDKTRLRADTGVTTRRQGELVYYPDMNDPNAPPYVYFDAGGDGSRYGTLGTAAAGSFNAADYAWAGAGVAMPYVHDINGNGSFDVGVDTWVSPNSFQIISTGPDKVFGAAASATETRRLYPTGVGYDAAGGDDDNATSFCKGSSLESDKP